MISILPDGDGSFGDHSGVEQAATKVKAAKLAAKAQAEIGPLKVTSQFGAFDTNGDGIITGADCPYEPGTVAAKAWWSNVQVPFIKATLSHPDAMQYIDQYGDKFHGFYNGKPMLSNVPASEIQGQGDFDFITDRLMITQGLSKGSAQNIAGYIKAKLGR